MKSEYIGQKDITTELPVSDDELKKYLWNIKVCRVATVPYFMVSQLKSQAEFLKDIGMHVALVSSPGQEWSQINANSKLSIKIINIPRNLSPFLDFLALIRLAFLFLKHRYKIVHSTTPKAGLLCAIAGFLTGIPVRLHTFTGQAWIAQRGIIRWASRLADKLIGFLNTKCYADSPSQAEFLIAHGIVSKGKIDVIGHGSLSGVDLKRFSPDRWTETMKKAMRDSLNINSSSRVIIFVGRISTDKGIGELIKAFLELLKINYDVDLLIVGPYDTDCGGKDVFNINEYRQYSRIHFTGYTECPEKYLAIADIFCLPSYREGFGTVVIEAAAMGLPTVGTKIYGLTDAIIDGETGILVPPKDYMSLFKALKYLLDNPDKLAKMGQAARARCFKYFDADIVNRKVAYEYLNILRMQKKIQN